MSVSPSTGVGPYTLSIVLFQKSLIDGVNYDLVVRFSSDYGVCPVPNGAPDVEIRDSLLNQGYYINETMVGSNRCLVYKVDIVNLKTSEVIDTRSVNVSRLT